LLLACACCEQKMIRVLVCFVLVALSCAEEAQPSTVDATFTSLVGSAESLATQEHFQRRLADLTLGLQVAQGFHAFGAAEYAKHHPDQAAASLEESSVNFDQQAARAKAHNKHYTRLEENENEDAQDLEELEADEFLELKEEEPISLEKQATIGKVQALKSLHLQLYLTSSDVERSYWNAKVFALFLPPQLTSFKLYKTYLNTLALSYAFQFHDSYTFEAIIDDFNDNFNGAGHTARTEALAEQIVYSNWFTLVSIKWQLFMISIYEQAMVPSQPSANANANSFLETEEQAEPAQPFTALPSNALLMQYAYMSYYVMMLKYYAVFTELQLAQTGLAASSLKVAIAASDTDDDTANLKKLLPLEAETLPYLYQSWAQTNQMRYMMEYYLLMFDLQSPAFAVSQATQRAENTFINMFQTDKASNSAQGVEKN
jgi:hypothetical protein